MLGKRLKELRSIYGMTQTELGKHVGAIKQTVSSWENDISSPNYEIICSIAKLFNVTTDYLLGASNEKEVKEALRIENIEEKQVQGYDKLNPANKKAINQLIENLLQSQEEKDR